MDFPFSWVKRISWVNDQTIATDFMNCVHLYSSYIFSIGNGGHVVFWYIISCQTLYMDGLYHLYFMLKKTARLYVWICRIVLRRVRPKLTQKARSVFVMFLYQVYFRKMTHNWNKKNTRFFSWSEIGIKTRFKLFWPVSGETWWKNLRMLNKFSTLFIFSRVNEFSFVFTNCNASYICIISY